MTNYLKVKVTQKNIDDGKCLDMACCPIALAFRKFYPQSFISVHSSHVLIDLQTYILPDKVIRFIKIFDLNTKARLRLKPFSFRINIW